VLHGNEATNIRKREAYSVSSEHAIKSQRNTGMKSFKTFRLDPANHLLWRDEDRVPVPPKGFDVLAHLVEHAGQVVKQDELLEALWPETYVNPEVLRRYILELRKILGDRPDKPEFIETLPKRGYRFIAPVKDENETNPRHLPRSPATPGRVTEEPFASETTSSGQQDHPVRVWLRKPAVISLLMMVVVAAVGASFRLARNNTRPSLQNNNPSIAVLPFADMSPSKDQEYFSDGLSEQLIHNLARVSGLKVVGRSSAFQFN